MSMSARREQFASTSLRYQQSGKKQKGLILDELVATTSHNRKYAIVLLSRKASTPVGSSPRVRHRRSTYGPDVKHALSTLWKLADGACGKLLVAALPLLIARLKAHGEMEFLPGVEEKLLAISPATIDRLLADARRVFGKSTTRPGSLLKHQIPVRTFADWSDARPGFAEIDLVAHCAEDASGEFVHTLTVTDVATCWTELVALRNRSQIGVSDGLSLARSRMPFPLLGIDCDNGSEFINHHLNRYCQEGGITFTRGRPARKNDQCYVEQKNGAVVRRLIGYMRYEGEDATAVVNRLYRVHRLRLNFFQPCRKLIGKTRVGAKVAKTYDEPRTPFQRLLASNALSPEEAKKLQERYEAINPADIGRRIDDLSHELRRHAGRSQGTRSEDVAQAAPPSRKRGVAIEGGAYGTAA